MRLIGMMWLALAAGAARGQSASAVAHLDMKQYTGRWYEIARLPSKAEKKCVSDSIVLYAEGDKPMRFQVVTSCRMKDGSTDVHNKAGRAHDKTGDGRLELTWLLPFPRKYWVLALDDSYQWALVGSPNHKELWVLSRSPALDPAVMAQIKAKAAGEGFAVDKLIVQPQTPAPTSAATGD